MDLIGILNQMSSAFNNESANTDKKEGIDLSSDKTLKWRGLHHNTYAMKDGKSPKRSSKRLKSDQSGKSNDSSSSETKATNSKVHLNNQKISQEDMQSPTIIEEQIKVTDSSTSEDSININRTNNNQTNNENENTELINSEINDSKEIALIEPTIETVTITEEVEEKNLSPVVSDVKPIMVNSPKPIAEPNILLAQMSDKFNKAVTQNKDVVLHMTEDKTLKWRSLHNNQFAAKDSKIVSRKSVRGKPDVQQKDNSTNKKETRVSRKSKRLDDSDAGIVSQEEEKPNTIEDSESNVGNGMLN